MADSLSSLERSRLMSSIPSRNTRPELYVRRLLWADGFRYRLHVKRLPGSPDLVLAKYHLIVFVHGCFWHQHGCSRAKRPSSNQEYWDRKLDGNVSRYSRDRIRLEELGWVVVTIWECALASGTESLLALLNDMRSERSGYAKAAWQGAVA